MEIKLLQNEGNLIRMAISGRLSRDGWVKPGDPFANLCGEDVFSRTVLLSLAETTHIDSTGVEWLLRANEKFQKGGGMLVIHSATPLTRQILKLMRMDLVLRIADNEAAARALANSSCQKQQE